MKKNLLLLLCLSLALLLFGCDSAGGGDGESETLSEAELHYIIRDGTSSYVIVRADESQGDETEAAIMVRRELEAMTGVSLSIGTDWVKRGEEVKSAEYEILVGNTNRSESEQNLQPNQYAIKLIGNKIVITGGSPAMILKAAEVFIDNCINKENASLAIPLATDVSASFLMAKTPAAGSDEMSTTPTFEWYDTEGDVTLKITKIRSPLEGDEDNTVVFEETGLSADHFTMSTPLDNSTVYEWSLVDADGAEVKGGRFMTQYDAKNHPSNKGLNFEFDGSVSREVLCNYLSRMLNHTFLSGDKSRVDEDIRLIKSTGAKYMGRATTPWSMGAWEFENFDYYKEVIDRVHEFDPEIVFETCIFETTYTSIEEIPIPAWVFEAFGLPVEERNFDYESMLFPDGQLVNQWGEGASVPDITRLETQLWFYYRGCTFIDMGFEAIHMGQVWLMGRNDRNYEKTTMVYNMIRDYAKVNARRHFVFLNAHAYNITGSDGKLLMDFHIFPMRGAVPDTELKHLAEEGNPQRMILMKNQGDSIYGNSIGGMTHSGWECESLPYVVEFDNYSGVDSESKLGIPIAYWGYDEISWFVNQPLSYKKEYLNYAWNWVRKVDDGIGYVEMPATRTAALRDPVTNTHTQSFYHANSTDFDPTGYDVEYIIKQVWEDSLKEEY
ncbi:MAG: hypothetical protein J6I45_12190 [Clostridia bacterium]|nr:hypothetical protein [Clostridia bacterium]